MPKFIDLTGQKFGRLLVMGRAENKNRRTMWKCLCSCGNECVVRGDLLKDGTTTSCGCAQKENTIKANFKDEVGKTYGYLTVISPLTEKDKDGVTMWVCRCKCGEEVVVKGSSLRSGHTQSCGCYQKHRVSETIFKNEIGNKYGRLTVVGYEGIQSKKALWRCQCECGNKIVAPGTHLRYGDVQSCGCLVSKGEAKIEQLLQQHKVQYIPQYSFSDLLSEKGYPLRFDFAIFSQNSLKCLVEYQGIQHYLDEAIGNWTSPKLHDNMKRKYCKQHNIILIEVSYEDYDKIDWDYLQEVLKLQGDENNE